MFKIGVLISGSGSNLKSIYENLDHKKYEISIVIGDRKCKGLTWAKSKGLETKTLDRKKYKEDISKEIGETLKKIDGVDLIVLAGFLSIIKLEQIEEYKGRMINIHPSLLPKYGGVGMYGIKIHERVLKEKNKESGCTVHYVEEGVDTGKIILQKKVDVGEQDTPETLQKKVLKEEHKLLPKAIELILEGQKTN